MTQQVIHCRVQLKSLDPEVDNSSFGFTFEATGSDTTFTFDNTSPVAALLAMFGGGSYVINGSTATIVPNMSQYIGPSMSRLSGDSAVYTQDITAHLNGSAAGPPLRVDTFQLGAGETETFPLPEGVALGCSWRADYAGASEFAPLARPRSRYRNRAYIGPLVGSTNTVAISATGGSRVSSIIGSDLNHMMLLLATNNTTVGTNHAQWDLVAWSRKDATVRDAEFAAQSERFDYQRRRTERATNETWYAIS